MEIYWNYRYICSKIIIIRMQSHFKIAATALALDCLTPQLSAQSYFDLVGDADKAISEGKWQSAEDLLTEAIELQPLNPSNILLLSNLGIVRYNLGKDSLAIATLDEAHRRAPVSVTVLSNRAQVLTAMGRDKDAYADYSRIIELDSTLIEPRYMHAIMALRQDEFDKSFEDCKALEQLSPEAQETQIAYASYYSATEQWENAIPYYTAILEKTPSTEMYAARAVCYLMLQRLNEASADITSGLELNPEDGELYLYRAYLNKMRYMNEDARADLTKAIRLGIDRKRAMQLIAE